MVKNIFQYINLILNLEGLKIGKPHHLNVQIEIFWEVIVQFSFSEDVMIVIVMLVAGMARVRMMVSID